MKAVNGLKISLILALATISSCSIKTDRSDCPCRLSIVMDNPQRPVEMSLFRDGLPVMERTIEENEFQEGVCVVDVVRGKYVFSIIYGRNPVPEGEQCDSLYAWSSMEMTNVNCEEATIYPLLHKQFATIFIELTSLGEDLSSLEILLTGDVIGISPEELEPVQGRFLCVPEKQSDNEFSVRVPRQRQGYNTLKANLSIDGKVLAVLPVGEYIDNTGYDWTNEDLGDVYVNISCMETEFGIEVTDWKVGFQKIEIL